LARDPARNPRCGASRRGGATERHDAGAAGAGPLLPDSPVPGPLVPGAAASDSAVPGQGGPGRADRADLRPDPATQMSDHELLRQHLAGDADAFGELFRRHRDRLWAVAIRTLGDPEEAADALQEAMISAFRRAASFRGDSAVTTWLHRIVVNACLDRLRRKAARPATTSADQQALDLAAVARNLPDPSAASDTSLDVRSALRMLPPDQQAALVLVDMLGYPVADAAEVLGVSTGTVKSRCSRGRARLLPYLVHLRQQPAQEAPGRWRRNRSAARRVEPSQEGGNDQP
jgi:RNA polymerase sigma-70 factor, ECF subfamily